MFFASACARLIGTVSEAVDVLPESVHFMPPRGLESLRVRACELIAMRLVSGDKFRPQGKHKRGFEITRMARKTAALMGSDCRQCVPGDHPVRTRADTDGMLECHIASRQLCEFVVTAVTVQQED